MGDFLNLSQGLVAEAGATEAHEPGIIGLFVYLALVIAIIFALFSIAKKDFGNRVFRDRFAQWAEQLYLFIENMCVGTIGAHGRKYVPMIMTFWLVIFVGNFVGLFFPFTPTADIGFNLGMALIAVGYVQWEGIQVNGVFGHFRHFAGPKLALALAPISVMIFVIEIISEVMKNVSLSLRLYGNIHGGHQAVEAMNKLGSGIYVPFGSFLLPIKLLTCLVQAMVFCLLLCVYFSLVTHHEEEHTEGSPAAAH
jgi:F-type H+-transporting ATPase subunit a